MAPDIYFPDMDGFPHAGLFENAAHAWEGLARLAGFVRELVEAGDASDLDPAAGLRAEEGMVASEGLFIARGRVRIPSAGLLIEEGARVEPGALIKGPTMLCAGAEVRHGAYLRGNCLIGPDAVVGHATEVKNSAFLRGAQAGHFAYVGDSILGARANLGAGVKLANLPLRTEEEKRGGAARSISVPTDGGPVDTGLAKFGAVVGDDAEIGCNAVTSPGTLLGPGCWVTPNASVAAGVYPARTLIRGAKSRTSPRRF